MKSLDEELFYIKEYLSNKKRWEEYWESNKITGYSSGSLGNTLGGIYNDEGKKHYRSAYDCVARAIITICGDIKESKPVMFGNGHMLDSEYMKFCPNEKDVRTINAFQEYKDHELLMKVLDTAIRYAKVYSFS